MSTLETRKSSWWATKAELGPRQREVLEQLTETPSGLTAWQLSEILGRLVHAVRPRLCELAKIGLIKTTGVRWQPKTARSEAVWVVNQQPGQMEMWGGNQ